LFEAYNCVPVIPFPACCCCCITQHHCNKQQEDFAILFIKILLNNVMGKYTCCPLHPGSYSNCWLRLNEKELIMIANAAY